MALRALPALASAGALILTLSGCAGGSGSDAVVIDGRRVSVTEVERTADAVAKTVRGDSATLRDQQLVVAALVAQALADSAAEKAGQPITPADRDAALASISGGTQIADVPDARPYAVAVGDIVYAQKALGAEAIAAQQVNTSIRVNPRYGSWDTQQMSLVSGTGSLSVPVTVR
ncbi:hypothetical protein GA0111570_101186 [Raineyella antarctica]|uniref:SurA N-terminal domain-containing protein n=1 Tax=Raineyella antarctica TaxID=1577474 RepID=A0A1G6GD68_9ACTN|nr:hypothetical protein [Raineyella antarctica]SDB79914.1 hypothetical protein GA0111570_101186 [Raineyella antarctica]